MSLIGIVPADLLEPDKKDDIIILLKSLDIPPRRKKQALVDWGLTVGIGLTQEDFQRLLGIEQKGV